MAKQEEKDEKADDSKKDDGKDNGKEEAAIVLNNKKPVYELDPVGNMVYYVSDGSEISAYKF